MILKSYVVTQYWMPDQGRKNTTLNQAEPVQVGLLAYTDRVFWIHGVSFIVGNSSNNLICNWSMNSNMAYIIWGWNSLTPCDRYEGITELMGIGHLMCAQIAQHPKKKRIFPWISQKTLSPKKALERMHCGLSCVWRKYLWKVWWYLPTGSRE